MCDLQAFGFRSNVKAKKLQSHAMEKEQRKLHIPKVDRNFGDLPPYVIVVHGPPKVACVFALNFFIFFVLSNN